MYLFFAGFTGGHILKKTRSKTTDLELEKLSSHNSQTLPDVVGIQSTRDAPSNPAASSSYSDPGTL